MPLLHDMQSYALINQYRNPLSRIKTLSVCFDDRTYIIVENQSWMLDIYLHPTLIRPGPQCNWKLGVNRYWHKEADVMPAVWCLIFAIMNRHCLTYNMHPSAECFLKQHILPFCEDVWLNLNKDQQYLVSSAKWSHLGRGYYI